VALTLTIGFVLKAMEDYLLKGLSLDLHALCEMPMVFNYLKYVFNMLLNNKRLVFKGFLEDLDKKGLANFEEDNAKFKQRRKRNSSTQKLVCDEYLLYPALV